MSLRSTRLICRFLRKDDGAGAAEFALVLPLMVVMIFGTYGGLAMTFAAVSLDFATQDAARCASVNTTCSNQAGVTTRGTNSYKGPTLGAMTFTLNSAAACGRRVVGAGSYPLKTGLATLNVPLSVTACYPAQS